MCRTKPTSAWARFYAKGKQYWKASAGCLRSRMHCAEPRRTAGCRGHRPGHARRFRRHFTHWYASALADSLSACRLHAAAADVKGSAEFIRSLNVRAHVAPTRLSDALPLTLSQIPMGYAADCGAGIGRVSRELLCPLFQSVDLVARSHAARPGRAPN